MTKPLIIGTRGSALALIQTQHVVDTLQQHFPTLELAVQVIKTLGDRVTDRSLAEIGGLGVFVKEIEHALLAGQIDLAVHSLKDVPSSIPEGLVLAAFLEREDPRDALVSRSGQTLDDLPAGSRLGTSSPRRLAQIRALRSDLVYLDLRGNVDTRLRKLAEGQYDAIVLAAAGIRRLDRAAEITELLPTARCLPAIGQGILAIEARAVDSFMLQQLESLDHAPARSAALAERALLRAFGAGCKIPLAGYAEVSLSNQHVHLTGLIASATGDRIYRSNAQGSTADAESVGYRVYERLIESGAELLTAGSERE